MRALELKSAVKVINAINKSLEFMQAIKSLNDEELNMVIRSFEKSIEEIKNEQIY